MLNNLIDNALKYTPSGGKVEVGVRTDFAAQNNQMLGIEIKDTGYGISEADRQHIFERHYRGIQAQSDIPGSGLGLAICKQIANKTPKKFDTP